MTNQLGYCDYIPPEGKVHYIGGPEHFKDPICINWRPMPNENSKTMAKVRAAIETCDCRVDENGIVVQCWEHFLD